MFSHAEVVRDKIDQESKLSEIEKSPLTEGKFAFFSETSAITRQKSFDDFFKILYKSRKNSVEYDVNAISTKIISRPYNYGPDRESIPDYEPNFYFILDGKRCDPKVVKTVFIYEDGAKFTDFEILLGNGSSKSVMEIGENAIFLPRVNNEETWNRMVDEEVTTSQKIQKTGLGIHTQNLSKEIVIIVDKSDEKKRATIPVMVAPSFNSWGHKNGCVYDSKNNKTYGAPLLLFNNQESNLHNTDWYCDLLKPLIDELVLCRALQIPCRGDSLNLLVLNEGGFDKAPSCHLMLYDFSSKFVEHKNVEFNQKEVPPFDNDKDFILTFGISQ